MEDSWLFVDIDTESKFLRYCGANSLNDLDFGIFSVAYPNSADIIYKFVNDDYRLKFILQFT